MPEKGQLSSNIYFPMAYLIILQCYYVNFSLKVVSLAQTYHTY